MKARWAHFRTWLSWLLMRRGEACIRVRRNGAMYMKGCTFKDGEVWIGPHRIASRAGATFYVEHALPDDSPRTFIRMEEPT